MGRDSEKVALLRELLTLAGEDRQQLLDSHPELLAVQHYQALSDHTLGDADHEAIVALLGELRQHVSSCELQEQELGFGRGPVELLWYDIYTGSRTLDQAKSVAATLGSAAEAEIYLRGLASVIGQFDPGNAVILSDLARTATAARPGGALSTQGGIQIELRFVRAAGALLVEEADGRLARAALQAGEVVLAHSRSSGDVELEVDALLGIGAMCSNPICARNSRGNLETELYVRQRQFRERHEAELAGLDDELWQMLPAKEMLQRAFTAFAEAAELQSGSARGRCRKAQATCLAYLKALDEPVDHQELIRYADEAVSLIDGDEALSDRVAVLGMLTEFGRPPDRAVLEDLLAASADRLLQRLGPSTAIEAALNTAGVVRQAETSLAVAAIRRVRPLVLAKGAARDRENLWTGEIDAAVAGWVPGGYAILRPHGVVDGHEMVLERARDEDWDPVAVAAALAGLARGSGQRDEEAGGLALLDEIGAAAPVWAAEHAEALDHLRLGLHVGQGANAFNASNWAAAVGSYSEALDAAILLDLPERALDVLSRIDSLIEVAGYEGAISAIIGLGSVALQLENLAGDAATASIQRICRHAIAHLVAGQSDGGTNPEALLAALQVAKGQRFASLLVSRQRFGWSEDDRGSELLDQIGRLEQGLGPDGLMDVDHPVDEHMMLAAFTTSRSSGSGGADVPAERLRSLRSAYDRHLHARMLGGATDVVLLGSQALETAIDARTALVELFLGRTAEGNAALYALGVTDTEIKASRVDLNFPDSVLELGDEQRKVKGSILTLVVSDLRRSLMEPSEPDAVTPATADGLRTLIDGYLQGLTTWLDAWRKEDRDHLCIVPHSSLHYVPFHLLPHAGEPLASTWTVTTLPNRALLLDSRGGATTTMRRRRRMAAFGLTYSGGGAHALRPLPHAATEAAAVAAVFDERPIVDADATEEALVTALQTARYVHVAAHGRHDYDAPAFQCVYLAPSDGSDGVLRAHELVALDLRGTEMVTLSACETSLGLVDEADNPRGLPAALLLAGVRCVVGTLWDVRSDTSEYFFTALYRHVAAGRPPQTAFSLAQRETRAEYPVYRDWGAFSLSGIGAPS